MAVAPTPPTGGPAVPDRSDRSTFSTRVGAWIEWFTNVIIAEIYALAQNVYDNAVAAFNSAAAASLSAAQAFSSPGTAGSSSTSLAIGIALVELETNIDKTWYPGLYFILASQSSPTDTWMTGRCAAYDPNTGDLTLQIDDFSGSGTHTDWIVGATAPAQRPAPKVDVDADMDLVPGVLHRLMAPGITLRLVDPQAGDRYYIKASDGSGDTCLIDLNGYKFEADSDDPDEIELDIEGIALALEYWDATNGLERV
jgi:hypothetical protein